MPRRSHLILVALAGFVLSLVLFAPAATLAGWLQPRLGSIELVGVDGTLREGRVAAIRKDGRTLIDALRWRWRLSDLLLGRFGADLSADGSVLLDGRVSRSFGSLRAQDLRLSGTLAPLLAAANQPFAPLDGQLALDLTRLRLQDRWPVDAEGVIRIDRLAWTLARTPLLLGSYEATLAPDGADLVATVRTLAGALEVNGDARAKPDRSYELHLQLKPRSNAPPMLQNLLNSLGAPDPQGFYHLRREGRLAAAADDSVPAAAETP